MKKNAFLSFIRRLRLAVFLVFVLNFYPSVSYSDQIIYPFTNPYGDFSFYSFPTNLYLSDNEILNILFLKLAGIDYLTFSSNNSALNQSSLYDYLPNILRNKATNISYIVNSPTSTVPYDYSLLSFFGVEDGPPYDFPLDLAMARSSTLEYYIGLHNQLALLYQSSTNRNLYIDISRYLIDSSTSRFYNPLSGSDIFLPSSSVFLSPLDYSSSDYNPFKLADYYQDRGLISLAYALLDNPSSGTPSVSTNSPLVVALKKSLGNSKIYTDINENVGTNEISESSLLGYTYHIDKDLHELKNPIFQIARDVAALVQQNAEKNADLARAFDNLTNDTSAIRSALSDSSGDGSSDGSFSGCFWGEDWSNFVYNTQSDKRLSYQVVEGNLTLPEYLSSWQEEFKNTSIGGSFRMRQFMGLLYTQALLTDNMRLSFASVFEQVSNLNANADVDMRSLYLDADSRASNLVESVDFSSYGDITNSAVAFLNGLKSVPGNNNPQKLRSLLSKTSSGEISENDFFEIVSESDVSDSFSDFMVHTNLMLSSFEILSKNLGVSSLEIQDYSMEFRSVDGSYYRLNFDFTQSSEFGQNAEKMRSVVRVLVRCLLVGIFLFSTYKTLFSLTKFMMGYVLTTKH